MTKTWTRNDYLLSQGFEKPGRGRPSLAVTACLDAALAQGVKFTDYPRHTTTITKVTAGKTEKVRVKAAKPAPQGKAIVEAAPEVYPESSKIFLDDKLKKVAKTTLREVCRNSGVSLGYCPCAIASNRVHMVLVQGTPRHVWVKAIY